MTSTARIKQILNIIEIGNTKFWNPELFRGLTEERMNGTEWSFGEKDKFHV